MEECYSAIINSCLMGGMSGKGIIYSWHGISLCMKCTIALCVHYTCSGGALNYTL